MAKYAHGSHSLLVLIPCLRPGPFAVVAGLTTRIRTRIFRNKRLHLREFRPRPPSLLDIKIQFPVLSCITMTKIYQYSGVHLFLVFWKASHAVMRYDEASIREVGFNSLSDFAVLELLLHKGSLPVNTIGEKVLLTSGSITTAVQRLERKGLVRRERGTEDARVVLVHLTEMGRNTIESAFDAHAGNLEELFEVFDAEERKRFADLMRKLGYHSAQLNR